jgi:hypothetical protein
MRCDSKASFLALTLASPYLDRKPKAKVTIIQVHNLVHLNMNGRGWNEISQKVESKERK